MINGYRGLVRLPCLSHLRLVSPRFSNKRRRISDRKKAPRKQQCHKPNSCLLALYSEDQLLEFVMKQEELQQETLLHWIARSGYTEALEAILTTLPESTLLQVADMRDCHGNTVLHCAASSGNVECVKAILALYPESQYMQVMCARDASENTVLHRAARSNNRETMKFLLNLLPRQQRSEAVTMQDAMGNTVFQLVLGSSATRNGYTDGCCPLL